MNDIQIYLWSDKFKHDTTVQVQDVLTRLAETLSSGIRAAVEKENEHARFWRKEKEKEE